MPEALATAFDRGSPHIGKRVVRFCKGKPPTNQPFPDANRGRTYHGRSRRNDNSQPRWSSRRSARSAECAPGPGFTRARCACRSGTVMPVKATEERRPAPDLQPRRLARVRGMRICKCSNANHGPAVARAVRGVSRRTGLSSSGAAVGAGIDHECQRDCCGLMMVAAAGCGLVRQPWLHSEDVVAART